MWEVSEGGGGVMGRMMLNCNLYQTYKFAYGAFYHFTIYVSPQFLMLLLLGLQ